MQAIIARTPEWAKKALVDFVEGFLAALLALNLAFPTTTDELRDVALAVGVAALHAFVSAVRRNAPGAIDWLRVQLGLATP